MKKTEAGIRQMQGEDAPPVVMGSTSGIRRTTKKPIRVYQEDVETGVLTPVKDVTEKEFNLVVDARANALKSHDKIKVGDKYRPVKLYPSFTIVQESLFKLKG